MRNTLLLAIILGLAGAPLTATHDAYADTDKPAISIVTARRIALARVPGTIVNEKLKDAKKKKHKPAVWSIKIRPRSVPASSDQLTKIEIDATTGAIVKLKDVKARKPDEE